MAAFASWLMGFARTFLTWLYNSFIDLLQGAIDGFAAFILSIVSLFPAGSPVPSSSESLPGGSVFTFFVGALNWMFPVGYLVTCVSFITGGMVLYFGIAVLARWVKGLT